MRFKGSKRKKIEGNREQKKRINRGGGPYSGTRSLSTKNARKENHGVSQTASFIRAARRHCRKTTYDKCGSLQIIPGVLYHQRQERQRPLTASTVSWFSASDYLSPLSLNHPPYIQLLPRDVPSPSGHALPTALRLTQKDVFSSFFSLKSPPLSFSCSLFYSYLPFRSLLLVTCTRVRKSKREGEGRRERENSLPNA